MNTVHVGWPHISYSRIAHARSDVSDMQMSAESTLIQLTNIDLLTEIKVWFR